MTAQVQPATGDDSLAAPVRGLLAGRDGWQLLARGPWWLVLPPAHRSREQGWKLHVSATVSDAVAVLCAATRVLTDDACAFKFAATARTVRLIGGRGCDRSSAGKFLTAYPDDDVHFARLAGALDAATRGLAGPAILSDRAYRPGSLVYYRFGGFDNRSVLDNDGMYRQVLTAPDGGMVPDRREAWFAPPRWAPAPLPTPAPSPTPAPHQSPDNPPKDPPERPATRAVLLGGRFLVRSAIRHSARGGVFLAEDTRPDGDGADTADTGDAVNLAESDRPADEVVVKQARPYTESDSSGQDSRDLLRNEARMLDLLAPDGLAPARVAMFTQDDQLFLAERRVAGTPLRHWVDVRAAGRPGPPRDEAVSMARRLVDLLGAVHRTGLVLRDLSPTNVMVDPKGRPVLVDLELATPTGELARRGGTPGYQAPEQAASDLERTRAATAEDLFSLGAMFFLLATGNDPILPEDRPSAHSPGRLADRLVRWLDLVVANTGGATAAGALTPAIRGLLRGEPAHRWNLERVRRSLCDPLASGVPATVIRSRPAGRGRLFGDGLAHLLATMTPGDRARLWPTGDVGARTDPCNVQHGAAGVLSVLTHIARTDDPNLPEVRPAVHAAAEWIGEALAGPGRDPDRPRVPGERGTPEVPGVLPGLYFGRAGTAWALYDAARTLDRPELADQAVELALRLPVEWPNSDITHGLAGAGLAHLHLSEQTGDARLAERAWRYAATVAERVARTDEGVFWPVPRSFDSRLAGLVHYGFAHGVAGIGWFLLAAARTFGDTDRLALAHEAGLTLCSAACRDGEAAWWPARPGGPGRFAHWCSGSS
ncbi:MAG TPA: class IV lanthionine synthetase LanL, partial [Mycobacteriales bacterium]